MENQFKMYYCFIISITVLQLTILFYLFFSRYQNLQYFATECIYAPNAYRGYARTFIKQLERLRPRSITDILISGQHLSQICKNVQKISSLKKLANDFGLKTSLTKSVCLQCGSVSSQKICHACSLLDMLNGGGKFLKTDIEYISIKMDSNEAHLKELPAIEDLGTKLLSKQSKGKDCACSK